ncbi:hypothetical protein OO013_19350 [Mangrovivirga sp. M17]|uniref:DUF1772 domain-containing protein n=1 Tax=Mangrovivirga halotolerans TaxID=2993936 RepID=A0ABT3RW88_9BACT|nr:hypothetical protein [Mangrovivirga halotolerans]MCX2746045.1 hypothetical protein [Mangrovivirga halotolerans]
MEIVRMIIDFGLFILIWLTQIIVYPGFRYMSQSEVSTWHKRYVARITALVAPLMITQLGIIIYFFIKDPGIINFICLAIVLLVWANTFFSAVPLHNKMTESGDVKIISAKLIKVNIIRTFGWTLIWILGVVNYLVF